MRNHTYNITCNKDAPYIPNMHHTCNMTSNICMHRTCNMHSMHVTYMSDATYATLLCMQHVHYMHVLLVRSFHATPMQHSCKIDGTCRWYVNIHANMPPKHACKTDIHTYVRAYILTRASSRTEHTLGDSPQGLFFIYSGLVELRTTSLMAACKVKNATLDRYRPSPIRAVIGLFACW